MADTITTSFTRSWSNTVNTALLTGTIPPQARLRDGRFGNLTYNFTGLAANVSIRRTDTKNQQGESQNINFAGVGANFFW